MIRRMLPIAAMLVMMLNASGAIRALHMIEHHAPAAHACADAGADQTPSDDQQPTPSEGDHECDLCLSLRAMNEVALSTPIEVAKTDLVSPLILLPEQRVFSTLYRPALGARAPPVC